MFRQICKNFTISCQTLEFVKKMDVYRGADVTDISALYTLTVIHKGLVFPNDAL